MTNPLIPVLIFELGHLQVFHYQTQEEFVKKSAPYIVYWQKKGEANVYGPFDSAWHAVNHYSEIIRAIKLASDPNVPDNVIHVDFRTKRRIK